MDTITFMGMLSKKLKTAKGLMLESLTILTCPIKAIRYVRTNGPILIREKLNLLKEIAYDQ